jgi:Cu2+-exporting ATPase
VHDAHEHDAHEHHAHEHDAHTDTPAEPGYPLHPELDHGSPQQATHGGGHGGHGGRADAGVDRSHAEHAEHAEHAGHGAHDKHAGHSVAMFRDKFWLSLLLTIPTLVWGHMLQRAFGYHAPMFRGSEWIPPVFGTAVFLYGGWPFMQGARREIRNRLPGMMTLIALAISVAFVFSAAVAIGYPGMRLW